MDRDKTTLESHRQRDTDITTGNRTMKTIQGSLIPFNEKQSITCRNISYIETQQDKDALSESRQIIYDTILSHTSKGGITDQDIAKITGIPLSSVNARRNEINQLIEGKMITDNGKIQYHDDRGRSRMRTLWVVKNI